MYSYVLSMVKNPSEAEEISQATFVKALEAGKGFRGEAQAFTWLCAIAKNLCFDFFREEKKKQVLGKSGTEGEAADKAGTPDQALIRKESTLTLHKLLHELKEPYREVFELRVFGELSFREIGLIFVKTESWARVTYHRARIRIKERMEEDGRKRKPGHL